jgi:hypothetical protein
MLGTLKAAVLMCAAAMIPFAVATVAWSPSAQAAGPAAGACPGGKQVKSAPLTANGSTWGTVRLCYNSSDAQAWAVITYSGPGCDAPEVVRCGGATVKHKGGSDAKHCDTADGATRCASSHIPDDAGNPSNASAWLCAVPSAPYVCKQYAVGHTGYYP